MALPVYHETRYASVTPVIEMDVASRLKHYPGSCRAFPAAFATCALPGHSWAS